MQRRGLTVRTSEGESTIPVTASADTASIGTVDLVLFSLKSYDTATAAQALTPLITRDTAVITFQNGLDNVEAIASVAGSEAVLAGAVYVALQPVRPGALLRTVVDGPRCATGPPGGSRPAHGRRRSSSKHARRADAGPPDDRGVAVGAPAIRMDDARTPRALSDSRLGEEAVMRLTDKVAIVTGAGSGIGAAIARTFAREGARVTITGRRKEPLDAVADEIAAAGGHALAVAGSVTDEADVQRAVQATLATFGRIDVLVNNAGSVLHAGPLHETSDEIWDGVMDVFLKGVFRFSRAVIPHMQRQGGGSLVNIGSVLGLKAAPAFPVHPHAVAKAGVAMLTKTIAVHYAKDGIRCNCVAPAVTETPLTESRLRDAATRTAMEAQYPLGRLGRPDDIAQAVLYLASDDAAWTTGTIVTVDGGIMA